ncbi:uncharacterized protein PRCAT00002975001 [Priceomyces carsonii]|uniref:uncharacterized protein n=1 Tax=Priceomyces carsonii TaxID=28549 RepID=UPI002EDA9C6C|nr:unnamed protein product [Priceomyces carsonii]
MGFELTFLGSSGGPIDGSTCSILLKPSHITYEEILSGKLENQLLIIDAGSGVASLSETIRNEVKFKKPTSKILSLYTDSLPLEQYFNSEVTTPFIKFPDSVSPLRHAFDIFKCVKSYLITHPHMDHICGLVVNSAGFTSSKKIYGSDFTIDSLQKYILNDAIWPNMSRYNVLSLESRDFWTPFAVTDQFTILMFDICHGNPAGKTDTFYSSSAFLIQLNSSTEYILIIGDFESDIVSKESKNLKIWKHIAPLIINESRYLKGIVLECSMPNNYRDELYGHMTPEHVIHELKVLDDECSKLLPSNSRPLEGLNVIINHVKEPIDGNSDPRRKLMRDLKLMNESHNLGLKLSLALTGVSLHV